MSCSLFPVTFFSSFLARNLQWLVVVDFPLTLNVRSVGNVLRSDPGTYLSPELVQALIDSGLLPSC
jgi:hypothetical protein